MDTILSSAYLPPIEYFFYLSKYRTIYIDLYENYIKQSYRNRFYISAANGKHSNTIPVIKTYGNHTPIRDIKIDYSQPWQKLQWRSIESAYNSSPFFLFYRDYFEPYFIKKYVYLIELNTELLQLLIKLCNISCEIKFTENYINASDNINDLRNSISPKNKAKDILIFSEYTQVFTDKKGFLTNLSIIDLLFNEGNLSNEYLSSGIINSHMKNI